MKRRTDVDCLTVVRTLTDYLDGALRPADRKRLERHLAGCPNCGGFLDELRRTIALVGQVDVETLDPAFREGVVAAFRDWRDH